MNYQFNKKELIETVARKLYGCEVIFAPPGYFKEDEGLVVKGVANGLYDKTYSSQDSALCSFYYEIKDSKREHEFKDELEHLLIYRTFKAYNSFCDWVGETLDYTDGPEFLKFILERCETLTKINMYWEEP